MRVTRLCPICEGSRKTVLYANKQAILNACDLSYLVVRCEDCGFHFADEIPTESVYQHYYNSASKYDSMGTVSDWDQSRVSFAVELYKKNAISTDYKLLDIGCGSGVFLNELKLAGFCDVHGIDPAPNAATAGAHAFHVFTIQQGNISSVPDQVDLQSFDVVSFLAVIEHLPFLFKDLRKIINSCKKGTLFLIEVPSIELFDGLRGEPFGEFSQEHIQFFSRQSIVNLFARLSLEIVSIATLELKSLCGGSIFALGKTSGDGETDKKLTKETASLEGYIRESQQHLELAMRLIPNEPYWLYGAGSHTARLLEKMSDQQRNNIYGLVDSNSNLIGKFMGVWQIQGPETLDKNSSIPVVISSFRSSKLIKDSLSERIANPIVVLY